MCTELLATIKDSYNYSYIYLVDFKFSTEIWSRKHGYEYAYKKDVLAHTPVRSTLILKNPIIANVIVI